VENHQNKRNSAFHCVSLKIANIEMNCVNYFGMDAIITLKEIVSPQFDVLFSFLQYLLIELE